MQDLSDSPLGRAVGTPHATTTSTCPPSREHPNLHRPASKTATQGPGLYAVRLADTHNDTSPGTSGRGRQPPYRPRIDREAVRRSRRLVRPLGSSLSLARTATKHVSAAKGRAGTRGPARQRQRAAHLHRQRHHHPGRHRRRMSRRAAAACGPHRSTSAARRPQKLPTRRVAPRGAAARSGRRALPR